jgi:heterodisulfide reductase subunit C
VAVAVFQAIEKVAVAGGSGNSGSHLGSVASKMAVVGWQWYQSTEKINAVRMIQKIHKITIYRQKVSEYIKITQKWQKI